MLIKPKKEIQEISYSILILQKSEQRRENYIYLLLQIKFTYVELHKSATKPIAAEFLRNLIKILPHTVLTDNGIQFTNQKRHKYAFQHIFDRVCKEHNIEHRLTKILGKLNETLKNTTTNYISNSQSIFIWLTIMLKDLKPLKGFTPCEFMCLQCS